jgi:hypothetical protein
LEKAEGCDYCCFLNVVGVDRYLVVSYDEVNFGKGGAAGKAAGVVLYVWDRIPVRVGASVQSSIISAMPPNAVLLGHEVDGGRPWTFGASGSDVLNHGV